ncbi:MAG: fasciclin domain-containing protein [Polyangiales bacterium]
MRLRTILAPLLTLALLGACSKDATPVTTTAAKEAATQQVGEPNIVTVAASAGDFNTLVAALKAAGLVETLQGDGPFTVFAPTDEAFAKLPAGTVDSLLLPENKAKLVAILTYHVVPGEVLAADVVKLSSADTVEGQPLSIRVDDGGIQVNGAHVTATDVMASNGVIHVIDSVLIPAS